MSGAGSDPDHFSFARLLHPLPTSAFKVFVDVLSHVHHSIASPFLLASLRSEGLETITEKTGSRLERREQRLAPPSLLLM